jgi:HEAT repeat protein
VGPGLYAFVHRTFLEYFCAASFLWDFKETQTLTIEALIAETFGKHWAEESWHEVLKLIASELDQKFVEQIIEFLLSVYEFGYSLDRDLEVGGISAIHGLSEWIVFLISRGAICNILLAADCFSEIRNPDLSKKIPNLLFNHLRQAVEGRERNDIESKLFKKNRDRQYLMLDEKSVSLLLDRIVTIWGRTHNIRAWLESLLNLKTSDLKLEISMFLSIPTITVIAQHWKDSPDLLLIIKSWGQDNQSWWLRQAAVQVLAQHWPGDPDTLPLLKKRARSDEENDVRQAAVRALAQGWKDDPDTFNLLKDRARSDEENDVRQAAVQALAKDWKDDPNTFNLFCEVATQDPCQRDHELQANPRQTALEGLLEIAPKNPQVIDLLRDRAANDPDDLLRKWATEQLTKINPQ